MALGKDLPFFAVHDIRTSHPNRYCTSSVPLVNETLFVPSLEAWNRYTKLHLIHYRRRLLTMTCPCSWWCKAENKDQQKSWARMVPTPPQPWPLQREDLEKEKSPSAQPQPRQAR